MPKCNKCGGEVEFRYVNGIRRPLHINGACLNKNSETSNQSRRLEDISKPSLFQSSDYRSALVKVPKTYSQKCFWCSETVYHHTNGNGNGDYILFDSLGLPWEIHECWKKHCYPPNLKVLDIEKLNFKLSLTRTSIIEVAINQL